MSSKTKLVVLHMKELIYTIVFILLGILLILLLVFMFQSGNKNEEEAEQTMRYQSGTYKAAIVLNDNVADLEVVIEKNKITSIAFDNLQEDVAAMYPLLQPTLDNISQQVYKSQSLENITYEEQNRYTSQMILQALDKIVEQAER